MQNFQIKNQIEPINLQNVQQNKKESKSQAPVLQQEQIVSAYESPGKFMNINDVLAQYQKYPQVQNLVSNLNPNNVNINKNSIKNTRSLNPIELKQNTLISQARTQEPPQVNINGQNITTATFQNNNSNITNEQAKFVNQTISSIPFNNMIPQKTASPSSGVNILIFNPSVLPGNANVSNSLNNFNSPQGPSIPNLDQNKNQEQKIAASDIKDNSDKIKTKKVSQLTDEYIKTMENYLRNENPEIRLMGIRELSKCFKEDESRKNDIALNSLLNLAIQDPSKKVRFLALSLLDNKQALGDNLTVNLLKKMQSSKEVYGEDALLASNILLDMASKEVTVRDFSKNNDKQKDKDKKDEK